MTWSRTPPFALLRLCRGRRVLFRLSCGFCFSDGHRSARLKQQRDLHACSVNGHICSERDRRGLVVVVGHVVGQRIRWRSKFSIFLCSKRRVGRGAQRCAHVNVTANCKLARGHASLCPPYARLPIRERHGEEKRPTRSEISTVTDHAVRLPRISLPLNPGYLLKDVDGRNKSGHDELMMART